MLQRSLMARASPPARLPPAVTLAASGFLRSAFPWRRTTPRSRIRVLAWRHGAETLEKAVQRAPEAAVRPVEAREQWMRRLAPPLDRALDRRLARHNVPAPSLRQSAATWLVEAFKKGLKPAHALQVLARAGVPFAETLQATSHAVTLTRRTAAHPVKAAVSLTAESLGVPGAALRLAALSLSVMRSMAQTLSR